MEPNQTPNQQNFVPLKKSNGMVSIVLAVFVIAAAALGFRYFQKDQATRVPIATATTNPHPAPVPNPTPQPNPTPVTPPTTPTPKPAPTTAFKDGTYSADGDYFAPSGSEKIGITLTVKNDIILSASAAVRATQPTSKKYQEVFAAGFGAKIVGKKMSEISLDTVSGSSLTPQGFNDAVSKIRAQAHS